MRIIRPTTPEDLTEITGMNMSNGHVLMGLLPDNTAYKLIGTKSIQITVSLDWFNKPYYEVPDIFKEEKNEETGSR